MITYPAVAKLTFLLLLGVPAQESEKDPFAGLWRPVHLKAEGKASEVLGAIASESGVFIPRPRDFEDKAVSVKLDGATFWQAVDAVCSRHGNMRLLTRPQRSGGKVIESGPWVDYPVHDAGPLRFNIYDVARVRELHYPGRRDRTDVAVVLRWTPEFIPVKNWPSLAGTLRPVRVLDDTGKSLLPELGEEFEHDFIAGGMLGPPASIWLFRLKPTAPTATRVAHIDLDWKGSFLAGVEEVKFDKPGEQVGESRQVGPMKLTLKEYGKDTHALARPHTWKYKIEVSYDPSRAPAEWKRGIEDVALAQRVLQEVSHEVLRFKKIRKTHTGHLWKLKEGGPTQAVFRGTIRAGDEFTKPVSITIRVGTEVRRARVPIRFKDVPMPEAHR